MSTDAASLNNKDVAGRNLTGPTAGGQRPRERRADPPTAQKTATPTRRTIPPSDHHATQLRETSGAAFLYATMTGLFQQIDTAAFQKFRDQLLADAGNPSDPIEIMMIEQIALAHLNVGRLQFRSATAETVDTAKIYGSMAVQLMGEFRRTALSLQAFRHASTHSVDRVVLEASRIEPETASEIAPEEEAPADDELIGKEAIIHGEGTIPFPAQEPEAAGRGTAERSEAERVIA